MSKTVDTFNEADKKVREEENQFDPIKRFIELSLNNLPKEWAEKRKFDLNILKRISIGYANQEVYNTLLQENKKEMQKSPLISNKKHKYINCVIIKVDDDYFIAKPRNKKNLFITGKKRPWFIKGSNDECYITEGETDAIRLKHIYPDSFIMSLGGVSDTKHLSELRKRFNGKNIIIVFDNDIAGQSTIPKAIKSLEKNYPVYENINIMDFSKEYKDIDEYFKNGGKKEDIKLEAVDRTQKEEKKSNGNKIKFEEEIEGILQNGIAEGKRNISSFFVARYFKEKKMPYILAKDYIIDWNKKNQPPLGDNELNKVIDSVYNYKEQHIEKEQVKEQKEDKQVKIKVRIPENDRLISKFADELGNIFKNKNMFFFKVEEKAVVEIRKLTHVDVETSKEEEYIGFKTLEPDRFVSLVEDDITPYKTVYGRLGSFFVDSSMTKNHSSLVLKSPQFERHLNKIKRIFTAPIPILYEGQLTFPKKGYDKRFDSWLPFDSPNIKEGMSLEDAKKLLYEIYNEFCFENKEDVTNAFAALITPFLRGLYKQFNERTPLFFYIANRERAGKDYCAGITGLVYEGVAIEEPPISSSDDGRIGHNEELRKKIMGVLMSGRKRMHFSNNKGFINNAVLEQIITNKTYSDRVLGKNEILTFDNEMDISLSGNMGVTFTPDLANRCRFIRLKLLMEDPNKRIFNKPNLHDWIVNKREEILSMMYCFVKVWIDKGMPDGTKPFTSFPEWARVCGGIMECCELGSPCEDNKKVLVVGGDSETEGMKKLYEFIYEQIKEEPIKKKDMIELIQEHGLQSEGIFHYLDFSKNSDKTKFGILIEKYVDRILSGIIMQCTNKDISSRYRNYTFSKFNEETTSINPINDINLIKDINLVYLPIVSLHKSIGKGGNVDKGDKVDIDINQDVVVNNNKTQDIDIKQKLLELLEKKNVEIQLFIDMMSGLGKSIKEIEDIINDGKKQSLWFEPRSGFLEKL